MIQFKTNSTDNKYQVNTGARTCGVPRDTGPVATLNQTEL